MKAWAADTGRRILLTVAQVGAAYLATASTLGQVDWSALALAITLAAIVTAIKAAATAPLAGRLGPWGQLAERVIATAAEAALGVIGAAVLLSEVDWPHVAGVAGVAALLAVLSNVQGIIAPATVPRVESVEPVPRNAVDADGDGEPDYAGDDGPGGFEVERYPTTP